MTAPPLVHFLEEQRRHRRTSAVSAALVAEGAGWVSLGAVLLAGVMALSVVGAAATLYALGWLLQKVLVAFPRSRWSVAP